MPSKDSIELREVAPMERVGNLFGPKPTYEPVDADDNDDDDDSDSDDGSDESFDQSDDHYSRVEYFIFLLLGVAMLWAWSVKAPHSPCALYSINILCSQEHVPRRRALLRASLQGRRLDSKPLSVRRDLGVLRDEPDLYGHPHQDAEERLIPAPNLSIPYHQHYMLCPIVGLDTVLDQSKCLLWLPHAYDPPGQLVYRTDTEWRIRVCLGL